MHGTTVPLDVGRQQSVARLEALARLMDGAFVLPGTTIRFGLDGIIGLIPWRATSSRVWYRPISFGKPDSSAHHWRESGSWRAFRDTRSVPSLRAMRSTFCSGPHENMALLRRHLEKKRYAQPVAARRMESRPLR